MLKWDLDALLDYKDEEFISFAVFIYVLVITESCAEHPSKANGTKVITNLRLLLGITCSTQTYLLLKEI